MNSFVARKYRQLLVWLQLPLLYQRIVVWWEFRSSLREKLKAARLFALHRSIDMRNAVFGSAMIVANRQIQSRTELRDMTHDQIMAAYRDGRLDYMMAANEGIRGYGDKTFCEWVKNGGQQRHNITVTRRWSPMFGEREDRRP